MATTHAAGSAPSGGVGRATWREWLGLAVLTLPVLVLATDLTVLFLAMPSIATDLQPGTAQMLWILHVYGFLVGGFLITMGRLGDRVGRRRLLLVGAAVFAALVVVAAYSTSAQMLIGARALLGVAGATLMPSSFALLRNMFHDGGQRRFAISLLTGAFTAGGALGPVLGGALLELFWWGSVFLVNLPALVLLVAVGPFVLPEYRDPHSLPLDVISVGLSLGAVLGVIYGLQEMVEHGFRPAYLVPVVAGLVFAVVFVRRQLRLADPLLDLSLFADRRFSASVGAVLLTVFALGGLLFLLTQYLQWAAGLSPLSAGVWMLPFAGANLVGALLAPLFARWMRHAYAMGTGSLLGALGLAFAALMAGVGVAGVGAGVVVTLGSDLIIGTAPPERAGSAASVQEVAGEMGQALGTAMLGSLGLLVYGRSVLDHLPAGVPEDAAAAARGGPAEGFGAAERLPAETGARLLDVLREAFGHGLVAAMSVGVVVFLVLFAAVPALLARSGVPE
ncbi:MFS transporter, DHA2 family, multidrug resistance protein [Haloechinothrix alba]|uniref:MFS transporter, DHA2 family, multidrug resistance protein n=1 Tax=Haloechinothrix alba TaxID=664784 RepID=A0A238XYM4_9PSEU|nr:MFS transporter [Haloechinothrix alba]SNR63444.1 MFS transporter, DHA2 family, multidrug resistance protein [Haloechinothrix alba]